MSYSIEYTIVTEVDRFRISLTKLKDYLKQKDVLDSLHLGEPAYLDWSEDTIELNIEGDIVYFVDLNLMGEGSSWAYRNLLLPMVELTEGLMEVFVMWERGQSVTYLEMDEGIYTEYEYEADDLSRIIMELSG